MFPLMTEPLIYLQSNLETTCTFVDACTPFDTACLTSPTTVDDASFRPHHLQDRPAGT